MLSAAKNLRWAMRGFFAALSMTKLYINQMKVDYAIGTGSIESAAQK